MKKRDKNPPKPKESSYSPQKFPIDYDNATKPKKKIRNKTEIIAGKSRGTKPVLKGKPKKSELLKPVRKNYKLRWKA
jgi:hypothetical protein